MKKFVITTIAALMIGTGAASAQEGDFVDNLNFSVLGGWSSHPALSIGGGHSNVEDGYNVGARIGYDLSNTLPLEGLSLNADYFYNQADYSHSGAQLGSSSFMGDLIYHLPSSTPLNFYGGAGIGAVHDNLDGVLHGSATVFGWQLLAGAEYQYSPTTAVFIEYRYQNAHDANTNLVQGIGNTSNNLSMGLKFNL